ncbi:Uncharacterized protein EJ110_NYTH47450 [Nymphaea thermarum]|nr:Uncharacterized protein EJ110_NYTH47450 [Nymphaea thermarum]
MDPVPMGAGTEGRLGSPGLRFAPRLELPVVFHVVSSSIPVVALVPAPTQTAVAWRPPPPSAGLTPPDVAWVRRCRSLFDVSRRRLACSPPCACLPKIPLPVLHCRQSDTAPGSTSCVFFCYSFTVGFFLFVVVMAEEMTSKTDVTFDTSLILRKLTSYDMWTVLARMYGRKKRVLRTYQIKRSIYSLKQGDLFVASFYAALKTKWEELDYYVNDAWNCGSDHELYWQKEWMVRTFIFLGGLRDEFESIRSQILNCDETPGIEEVYARVESEEQRRQVMHIDSSHGSSPSAFVSRAPGTGQRPTRRCSHCNKLGHSVDYCWDLHPEKRLTRGRPPSGRRGPPVPDTSSSSFEKPKLSSDQIKELQAYISRLSTTKEEASTSEGAQLAQALVATSDQAPGLKHNGFVFVKIRGGFHEIRNAISDIVAISRLLNAALVIPELQSTTSSKGVSSGFKSFNYLYDEDHFIAALAKDVMVVKTLPQQLKVAKKNNDVPVFTVRFSTSPDFYLKSVLPMLKRHRVVEILVPDGGCLQALLPPVFEEYQRLRCRVAFHALRFRREVQELGTKIVRRLQTSGRPFIVFDPGLTKDALAYHGCAEQFQACGYYC